MRAQSRAVRVALLVALGVGSIAPAVAQAQPPRRPGVNVSTFVELRNPGGVAMVSFDEKESELWTVLVTFDRLLQRSLGKRLVFDEGLNDPITVRSPGLLPVPEAWSLVETWLLAHQFAVEDLGDSISIRKIEGVAEPEDDEADPSGRIRDELQGSGISTVHADGRGGGLRVDRLQPDGLLEAIGLRGGDTLLECNGHGLDSEAGVEDLIACLAESHVSLLVRGTDGQERLHAHQRH